MSTPVENYHTLNNKLKMPSLGLGVWQSDNGQETVNAIHWALDAGYRHIDTARIYKNEEAVGKALGSASVPRDRVWLTTKIWNDDIRQGRTTEALEESLRRLDTDYVDLLLLHWPVDGYREAWQAMERAVQAGKVRSIGLSNFMTDHLAEIDAAGNIAPAVNQIEMHPHLLQHEAIEASQRHGAAVTAWSPLMQGKFLDVDLFEQIGEEYGKTAAQVCLRWCLQKDAIVIPKSVHKGRIEENGQIFDFELSDKDMRAIDALPKNQRLGPDPNNFDF